MPRVGLFGLLGQGNLGNDGSMEAVLAYLRAQHPDVVLDALCSGPELVSARYGIPAARLHWYYPERQARVRPGRPSRGGTWTWARADHRHLPDRRLGPPA